MKPNLGLPLFWKVCLINGAVFTAGATALVVSPATVSPQPTPREVLVLACGLVVIFAGNALLLRGVLTPLDRLIQRIDRFDIASPGQRLPDFGDRVAASVAGSFNALLSRLERERADGSARALAAQEEERRRIAQDLHDEVGQSLTVVLLSTRRALDLSAGEVEQELLVIQDSARSGLEEVKRIVQGLRPGVLEDLGLITALSAMVKEFEARSAIDVQLHLPADPLPLPGQTELVIFRVGQEALTNVSRHATASTLVVGLSTEGGSVTLSVVDDGHGIDAPAPGEGIRGMRERALAVGGDLRISSVPGGGTEVCLRVPVAAGWR